MRILLSNDDGYRAEGLQALRAALSAVAEVEVVAPEHNNSAKSNALTLNAPLYVHEATYPRIKQYVSMVFMTYFFCIHL